MAHYITVDDRVRLACRVEGGEDLPALVFSNSLGTDLHMWDGQVEALRDKFRIVRYDTRGHGLSSVPQRPATIERLGRDLLAVLDQYGIERAHVCGLSMGGLTAIWVAVTHPERVSRVVLANTAARIGTDEGWNQRIEAVRAGGMAAVSDTVVSRFFSEGFRARQPEVVGSTADMLLATDPQGYNTACEAIRDTDLRSVVSKIRAPTLIIGGSVDVSTPASQAEELYLEIEGSKLVVFEDTAHLSNIEQSAAFNDLLLQFLAGGETAT